MLRPLMFLTLLLCLSSSAQAEPITVRGRVILDLNANGQLDANETGLSGVAVTDGMQFVQTGEDGTFEFKTADDPVIPYKPAQIVNLCWGTGYWPTGLWYRRLADIKPGEQLLFGLRKDEQKLPLAVIQSTDPHNNYTGELSANWRQEVLGLGNVPKFAIITGDLGYASLESADNMFGSIQAYARSFPVPMFLTPGNHDVSLIHTKDWKKQHELAASGGYTKYLGPLRWSFDYAGIHFVGLDWVYETPDGKLDGGTPKSAVDWLAKDLERLKPGTRIFAFSHSQWSPQEEFYDVLRKHKVELFLAGHSHQNLDVSSDGLKMLTTVNLLGIDAPYCLLHIYDGGHDAVGRCTGKAKSNHRGDCALRVPPFEALRREHATVASETVDNASRKLGDIRSNWLEVEAQIDPAQAKRCGVRILHDAAGVAPLEIAFEGNSLLCGGLSTPEVRQKADEKWRLHIHIANGWVQVRANDRVFFERRMATDQPCRAELFADGGKAVFTQADVWRLADDDVKGLEALSFFHNYGRQKRQGDEFKAAAQRAAATQGK